MKKNLLFGFVLLAVSNIWAASITVSGSYTTNWKSTSPLTFKGTLNSKSSAEYEGDIIAPWNGKDETYKGTLMVSSKSVSGEFVLQSQKRRFTFTGEMGGSSYKCNVKENGANVGVLDMKISGAGGSSGFEWAPLVTEIVGRNTAVNPDSIIALFEKKGSNKDDIISVCAVADVVGMDVEELYAKKKKFNTNYEFMKELKLDKENKKKVEDLIKKIKDELDVEKRKKK